MKIIPSVGDYSDKRLFSLDLLRGLDMFYLAVVTTILTPLFSALGLDAAWNHFFCTHPWEGFTLYDLIMPLFIFMCGAAVPFSLGRRLKNGKPVAGYWKHVWLRVFLLWILGMLAQGGLATLDIHRISFYSNTLQAIAFGYLVAAYVITIPSWKVRVSIPIVLTIAYGLIVHFGGDYSKDGNITQIVELRILNAILPSDNEQVGYIVKYGYTWYLPSMMFPVITLAGCFATEILKRKDIQEWTKAGYLFLYGILALSAGWVLELLGVKTVKHIFTVSFTLQAVGWSVVSLAVLFVVTDIWKFRCGFGLLVLFGQFALTAYLCESVFREVCFACSDRLLAGVQRIVGERWGDTVRAIGFGCVVIGALVVRFNLKLCEMSRRKADS